MVKLKLFKRSQKEKTPLERVEKVIDYLNVSLKLFLLTMNPAVQPPLKCYTLFLLAIAAIVFDVYTAIWYDSEISFKSLVILGFGLQVKSIYFSYIHLIPNIPHIQGIVKYVYFFVLRKRVWAIWLLYLHIYRINSARNTDNFDIVDKASTNLLNLIQIWTTLLINLFIIILIMAFYSLYHRELVFFVYIPGVDETTTTGLYILFVYDLIILFIGINGVMLAETWCIFLVANLWPMVQIFERNVTALNEMQNVKKPNKLEINLCFMNIVRGHQDLYR